MDIGYEDKWFDEVHGAIKRYQRASELKRHASRHWPAVHELVNQGFDTVTAIRRVLDQACQQLEGTHFSEIQLLRKQYVERRTPEVIAEEGGFDKTSFHRWRNQALSELAVVIAEANRTAKSRSSRFTPRLPVIGFDPLVVDITDRLRDPSGPAVIVIEGMGGLGKTTLAQLIAHYVLTENYFAGVLWVSAKQTVLDQWFGQSDRVQQHLTQTSDLIAELAKELNIDISGEFGVLQQEVYIRCKSSPYLIVIDNLETVQDITRLNSLIERLVVPSRVLLTARDRSAEALPASLSRYYIPLRELNDHTSYQLLRRAAEYNHTDALSQATDMDLSKIYVVTGGNPLALWLVAGQARGLPLDVFIRDLLEPSSSMSKSYALYDYLYHRSWEQLSLDAQQVLIATYRCEFGAEYHLLRTLSLLEAKNFHQAIQELINRMLLFFDGNLYHIHRLTYNFLRALIVKNIDVVNVPNMMVLVHEMANVHAQYLLNHASHLAPAISTSQAARLIRDWAGPLDRPSLAIRFILDFHLIVAHWSTWGEWPEALDRVLNVSLESTTRVDQIYLLNYRSQAARELDQYNDAEYYAARALQLAEMTSKPDLISMSLNKLGLAALGQDDLLGAYGHLERAYKLCEEAEPSIECGHIYMNFGLVTLRQGNLQEAEQLFHRALYSYQAKDNQLYAARAYCSIVDVRRRGGLLTSFPRELSRAKETFNGAGDRYAYGLAENDAGCIYLMLGQLNEARQAFKTAVETFDQIGARGAKARVLSNVGELYVTSAQWDEAQVVLAEARQLAVACEKPLLVAAIDVDIGRMLAAQGDYDGARRTWQTALAVQRAQGAAAAAAYTNQLLHTVIDEHADQETKFC